jgi:integrase/recombinase XerC
VKSDVESFLQHLSIVKGCSSHTVLAYRSDLDQFIDFLQNRRNADEIKTSIVSKDDVRAFLGDLIRHGASKRSAARKLAAIRSFFNFAVRTGISQVHPGLNVASPKMEKRLPEFLPEDQMNRAIEGLDSDSSLGLRNIAILELFYGAGLRVSELAGLNLTDVDLPASTIRVFGKGGKTRVLPIGRHPSSALQKYFDIRPDLGPKDGNQAVFLSRLGARITTRGIQYLVRQWLSKVSEKERLSPHVIRHSFATHLVDNGADLESVKELLGHASLSTTQIYTHLSVESLKKVYRQAFPRAERT